MSLLPAKSNLTAWRGGSFRKTFTLYTGSDATSDPRDLTGHSATFIIYDADDVQLHSATVTLGGTAGTIEVYISDENTDGFAWSNGTYELLLEDVAGDVDPLLHGTFTVKGI